MKRRLDCERLEKRLALAANLFETSVDSIWELRPRIPATQGSVSYIHPLKYSTAVMDHDALRQYLAEAPMEFTREASSAPLILSLPTPTNHFARFAVVNSPIMEPGLATQFPGIMTFAGQGIDDPAASIRFDIGPNGFHAQVLTPSGAYYIDPFWHLDDSVYVSYFKSDLVRHVDNAFVEHVQIDQNTGVKEPGQESLDSDLISLNSLNGLDSLSADGEGNEGTKSSGAPAGRSGAQLRTYRLANAATGEYVAFHGGTVESGQAAIVTAINRVTGIYEVELSVRLVLVANNSLLVYTDAATDPYTNSNASALLTQNQTNLDNTIGSANYDIGHVFSTGGGGLAGLGVVGVNGRKAQGETGLPAPTGDAFYVDYVAHEMGHQFGGNHTFNGTGGSCNGNRASSAAYEPGSGSTIQAYAGICGADDLQPNSDPYFHSASFDEIVAYTTSGIGNTVAAITNTGNTVPRINAGVDFVIPAQTPFVLNAAGIDADTSDVLTYNWEQRDLGAAQALSAADNGSSPLFRSFSPTTSTERVIPRLSNLINNTTAVGEKYPTTTRTLKFRATVRDNRSGGGGVNTDDMQISVVNTGAPFAVTSPNSAVSWTGGSTQNVAWNVAGTTAAPINTSNVNILMSLDGGLTFPVVLLSNTPNDGSEDIVVPNLTTPTARIKVEASNSIYFDISNTNFSISGDTNTPPTISNIQNQIVSMGGNTGALPFVVGDAQTAVDALVVTTSSSNTTLVPNGSISIGGTGANRTVTVNSAAGQFGQTTISVMVTDAQGLKTQETFIVIVEKVVVCSAFESFDSVSTPNLPADWTTSATGSAPANWATSNVSSSDGTNNVFVSNPTNTSDSRLTSPMIAISTSNNEFRFKNNYNLESTYDGGILEISINGGVFTDVVSAGGSFKTGGYNGVLSSQFSNPIGGRQAWTGNSGGYVDTIVELPASALGANIQFRWRMGSDSTLAATGWRVDAIQSCGIANQPPTSLTLTPSSISLAENSNTVSPTNVSTIAIVDDGLGTNTLSLTGPDAASFEIAGDQLRLKAGVSLDFETKPSYSVTVQVDDPAVGSSPDRTANFSLNVTNVNEAPSISVAVASLTGNAFSAMNNMGSWSDPEGVVNITSSVGTATRNANGTWDWTYIPTSAFTNQTVTITATDAGGLTATTTFQITSLVAVTGRYAFYAGSDFNQVGGLSAALDASKTLLRAGASPADTSFSNIINYVYGINGVVIDIGGLANNALTADDFVFRVAPTGTSGVTSPSAWPIAPAPSSIQVTPGTTTNPARVRIEWPNNSIENTWLQIIVKANANTGLINREVFYLGHALGDVDGEAPYRVTTLDVLSTRSSVGNAIVDVSDMRDVDKDRRITTLDVAFIRSRVGNNVLLNNITIPAAGSGGEGEQSKQEHSVEIEFFDRYFANWDINSTIPSFRRAKR